MSSRNTTPKRSSSQTRTRSRSGSAGESPATGVVRGTRAAASGRRQQRKAHSKIDAPAKDRHETEQLLSAGARHDIAGVTLAVVAIALFIAVIAPGGAVVSVTVSDGLLLALGVGAYLMPLLLLAWAMSFFVQLDLVSVRRTGIGLLLIAFAIITLIALFTPGATEDASVLFDRSELIGRGGYLGAGMAWLLITLFNRLIGTVVAVGTIVAGLIVAGLQIGSIIEKARARHSLSRSQARVARRMTPLSAASDDQEIVFDAIGDVVPANPAPGEQKDGAAWEPLLPGEQTRRFQPTSSQNGKGSAPYSPKGLFARLFGRARGTAGAQVALEDPWGAPMDAEGEFEAKPAAPASRITRLGGFDATTRLEHAGITQVLGDEAPSWYGQDASANDGGVGDYEYERAFSSASATRSLDVIEQPDSPSSAAQIDDGGKPPLAPWDDPAAKPVAATLCSSQTTRLPSAEAVAAVNAAATRFDAPIASPSQSQPEKKRPDSSSKSDATTSLRVSAKAEGASGSFVLPDPRILKTSRAVNRALKDETDCAETAGALQQTLEDFKVNAKVVGWTNGPTVTQYRIEMPTGVRVNRITQLQDDIALALAADSVRVFAPIPGTSYVGVEVPNRVRRPVMLGDIIGSFKRGDGPLMMAIGRDVDGSPVMADLASMPHLLIAGTTGSGKSVAENSMIVSMLMRSTPEEVRMILIDPKRVELSAYEGIPHLYVPPVTEPGEAASALTWGTVEMERRFKLIQKAGTRNITRYNKMVCEGRLDDPCARRLPYLVIVIDELADLMMQARKEVETSICRIAQLGRAAGIHLIIATQRPSTDIVTGLIKTNITNRVALKVGSSIDSRVILDQTGAERLLGNGDMLFLLNKWPKPRRIQGCYVEDKEIRDICDHLRAQGAPDYHEDILQMAQGSGYASGAGLDAGDDDPLVWDAAEAVISMGFGSTSGLQRRLKVGYARAGRIMDMLEAKGIVGPPDGTKPREVLVDELELESLKAFELADGHSVGGAN